MDGISQCYVDLQRGDVLAVIPVLINLVHALSRKVCFLSPLLEISQQQKKLLIVGCLQQ